MKKLLCMGFFILLTGCASLSFDSELHAKSPYDAGMHYLLGIGVKQDSAKAKYYFEKSAREGNPYAESELGFMYASGKGEPQDYAQAFTWYEKAANDGLASAQYNLALFYLNGLGTPVNKAKALYYMRLSAEHGFQPAKDALQTNQNL